LEGGRLRRFPFSAIIGVATAVGVEADLIIAIVLPLEVEVGIAHEHDASALFNPHIEEFDIVVREPNHFTAQQADGGSAGGQIPLVIEVLFNLFGEGAQRGHMTLKDFISGQIFNGERIHKITSSS
jgi:hypothetical protein